MKKQRAVNRNIKDKTKARSVHQGHRERKTKILKHNLDIFEEHQILELLLFYGLPRADTKSDCT